MKAILYLFSVCFLLSSCKKEERIKLPYKGFTPQNTNDGWVISSPENEQILAQELEEVYSLLYEDDQFPMAKSLLVIRNGKIVAEAYPMDEQDREKYSNIQSCTKSITSIMVGVAMQQGLLSSTQVKLVDLFPSLFPNHNEALKEIRLHHALTMQSGLEFYNSKYTLQLYQTKQNSTAFVLQQKSVAAPGQKIHYSDGDPHLVSKAIEVVSGKSLQQFADATLFKKLGITNYLWEQAKDGTTFGAFSLFVTPRDLGKIGQLLLQNGQWNNEQLIDTNYLQMALSHQVNINLGDESYGYYFWLDPEKNTFSANGHGGQYLYVAPDKNLVVVYTAWPYTNGDLQGKAMELIDRIWAACK